MPMSPAMPSVEMPSDLMAAAQESEDIVGAELAALVPAFERPIGTKVMNALAKAVAAVGRVMGMEIQPDAYTEPVMELEPDVIRFLAMMDAAAEDYGKPLPVRLDELRTEADLTTLTAALMQLAQDDAFEEFLDMPDGDQEREADVEVAIDVKPDGEMEEEFDFASRMGRR